MVRENVATVLQHPAMFNDSVRENLCLGRDVQDDVIWQALAISQMKETVEAMRAGSVIVDMAASTGGNCELTENDQVISRHGVTIIGDSNIPGSMSVDSSFMFGKNIFNFVKLIIDKEGGLNLNWEDDIVAGTCITHEGAVKNERIQKVLEANQ